MSTNGKPDVIYYIFDYVKQHIAIPYFLRMTDLSEVTHAHVRLVLPEVIENEQQLLRYEEECINLGYEGVMIRSKMGPYKEGRSTVKEGYLLKLKRFEDSEAKVVGFEERMHNDNDAEEDAFGRTKRSSAKAGLVPDGTLGKIRVVDIHNGVDFEIGTGFSQAQRDNIWANRKAWLGRVVKYKFQPSGMKDKPRFPVYIAPSNEGKF